MAAAEANAEPESPSKPKKKKHFEMIRLKSKILKKQKIEEENKIVERNKRNWQKVLDLDKQMQQVQAKPKAKPKYQMSEEEMKEQVRFASID